MKFSLLFLFIFINLSVFSQDLPWFLNTSEFKKWVIENNVKTVGSVYDSGLYSNSIEDFGVGDEEILIEQNIRTIFINPLGEIDQVYRANIFVGYGSLGPLSKSNYDLIDGKLKERVYHKSNHLDLLNNENYKRYRHYGSGSYYRLSDSLKLLIIDHQSLSKTKNDSTFIYRYSLYNIDNYVNNHYLSVNNYTYNYKDGKIIENFAEFIVTNDPISKLKIDYSERISGQYDKEQVYKRYNYFSKKHLLSIHEEPKTIGRAVALFYKDSKVKKEIDLLKKPLNKLLNSKLGKSTITYEKEAIGDSDSLARLFQCLKVSYITLGNSKTEYFVVESTLPRYNTEFEYDNYERLDNKSRNGLFRLDNDRQYGMLPWFRSNMLIFKLKTTYQNNGEIKKRVCLFYSQKKGKWLPWFTEKYNKEGRISEIDIFDFDYNFKSLRSNEFLLSELKNELGFSFYLGIGKYKVNYSDIGFDIKKENGDIVFSFEKEQVLDYTINLKKEITYEVGYVDNRKP